MFRINRIMIQPRWLRRTLFLLPLLAAGCFATSPQPSPEKPTAAVSPEQRQRAAALSALLGKFPAAVVVTAGTLSDFENRYAVLADRIALLGFREVVIEWPGPKLPAADSAFDRQLRALLSELAGRRVPVRFLLRQGSFYRDSGQQRPWVEAAREVAGRIQTLPEPERPQGLLLALEPHRFTALTRNRPRSLLYAWGDKHYGPGLDNDQLLKLTLEDLVRVRELLAPLPVIPILPSFYPEEQAKKRLSVGDPAVDYGAPPLAVTAYGEKPSVMTASVSTLLARLQDTPRAVTVEVILARHTYETTISLRRRDWADLMAILTYALRDWERQPAYQGLLFNSYAALAGLWEQ